MRLEQLRELGERLVHVHSQHQAQLLHDPQFQLGLVDQTAGHQKTVAAYRSEHKAWQTLATALAEAREEEARSRTEQDFLLFQLEELDQAQLNEGEQEGLELELQRAEYAGEILEALQRTETTITGEEGLVSALAALKHHLARIARHDPGVSALLDRLNSAGIELQDIADDASKAGARRPPRSEASRSLAGTAGCAATPATETPREGERRLDHPARRPTQACRACCLAH
ncbi:MAG: hypothetical protein IPK99_01395 [Flavobacteriales bacterium]|nr:hypothetical protein [Flavobacteriales bacterium]